MITRSSIATVVLATTTILLAACTRSVDDAQAVAGGALSGVAASAAECEAVDAPLATIPALADDEPVLRIPQPQGWERSTSRDSELIRFASLNRGLISDSFAPNVVVTLESVPGIQDSDVAFGVQRMQLERAFGATDLRSTEHTLCGLPAETVRYQTPTLGNVAAHPATGVGAVLHSADRTYMSTVTVQTTDPEDPTYRRDAEMILSGFQMLPPPPRG